MLNYRNNPQFSQHRSQTRIEKANRILGPGVVRRLLAFALYLLGAKRQSLAQFLNMPLDTLKSVVQGVSERGLGALEDRRHKSSAFLPPKPAEVFKPRLIINPDRLLIVLNESGLKMEILRKNTVQCRTVLLSMLANNLLSLEAVSKGLDLSMERTKKLKAKLQKQDVLELIDRRRGQLADYRVTPEVKAELIQQFVLNLTTQASTSSNQLSNDLQERCQLDLASRTIRLHVAKLGLRVISQSLPKLLGTVKKTSRN